MSRRVVARLVCVASEARAACAALGAALLVAGCGGGFFIGIGDGFDDGDPPSVSVVAAPTSAAAGQTVRLSAAAADDLGIDRVEFWRVDATADVRLFSDFQSPYVFDAAIPVGASGSVEFYAVAVDVEGHARASAPVAVAVVP